MPLFKVQSLYAKHKSFPFVPFLCTAPIGGCYEQNDFRGKECRSAPTVFQIS